MNDWWAILVFFYGIALGVWIGWVKWRRPQLKYKDEE